MRTKMLLPMLALALCYPAGEFTDGGGGTPPPPPEDRPNAIDGSVLKIQDVEFVFLTAADPENPFHVQIGATADETDRNLEAAIQAAAAYGGKKDEGDADGKPTNGGEKPDVDETKFVETDPFATVPGQEGQGAIALEIVADQPAAGTAPEDFAPNPPATFSDLYPAIGEWFDRVQKWAQFEGRPIPELNASFISAFQDEELPTDAAARLCQGKTDFATANKQGA